MAFIIIFDTNVVLRVDPNSKWKCISFKTDVFMMFSG